MAALFFQNGVSIGSDAGWCGYTGSNNYVVRYQFSTGSSGADSVSIALGGIYYGSGAGTQGFGFKVSSSSVAYANARNLTPDSNYGVMSYSGSGYGCQLSASGLNLAPNSVYYLFVFVATGGTEYYSGWNCTAPQISLSGSYTPPAGAISSISGSVSTGSALSLIVNSPYPYHRAFFSYGEKELAQSELFGSALSQLCPREWMAEDISAQSMEIKVRVQGYRDSSGNTAAGESMEGSFILKADPQMQPTLPASAVSISAVNDGAAADFTEFISGISRALVRIDPSLAGLENCAGAEIVGYSVSYRDVRLQSESPELETGLLSGDCLINCAVIDSRGREGSVGISLAMLPYVPPSLTSLEAVRCDSDGGDNELGEYIKFRAVSTFTELSGKNSCTVTAAIQPTGGSWGEETALPGFESGAWSHQWTTPQLLGGALQGDSYKLSLVICDALNCASRYTLGLYHQRWAMKFNEKGTAVGFGMEPTVEKALQLPEEWRLYAGGIVLSEKSYGYLEPEEAVAEPVEGMLYFLISD